jgi:phenylalanyl-tRNA synthetase alpha chain
MPEIHPAREMQDTFYIDKSNKKLLPRTHTSGMQVRFMKQNNPPFKIIVPGKVFRNENEDATHSWTFGQIEGLVVGEGVSVTDLRGTLLEIVKKQLGPETEIRFRASYFPYTEPSMEVDAKFKGKWLELGGAGMVHPQVLINGGIDPEKYSGFAFGWGVERLAVIKYGITDLRELWRPKFDYLEQF